MSHDRHVVGGVSDAHTGVVFSENDVQDPVKAIFNRPVKTRGVQEGFSLSGPAATTSEEAYRALTTSRCPLCLSNSYDVPVDTVGAITRATSSAAFDYTGDGDITCGVTVGPWSTGSLPRQLSRSIRISRADMSGGQA